ncbi:UDP-N-acetylmuramoyl-L-alanyl-D-glutamate--2,6-diaminopimelate ligase [Variovorax terrae]|uniref:UDP-N-acetylmuramoyl-L-alanyl-D-glutamate--2,6-diaminopimelate ligase n=1 Tax=Variovorax terrae TaxID=2923278 RepID=A0A9X1VUA3_9BURK|nr:UDP-N-acetylmuramoyl-L-alanyl-D-glutamate--2,6-diaminopimelate ligase [Variovorax terrae]MCJ0761972.1 UDP-N-acetylmuramoyl-L-alanyl-D-glutamate--2,6-diaminopimelate ligase [Variovorax terrae]
MQELRTPAQAAQWLHSRMSGTLHVDSRRIGAGDGFIAWPGAATDGRQYVGAALAQGAAACLVEKAGVAAYGLGGDAVAVYEHLKAATGPIAAAFYGEPTRELDVIAITGTNGKTSSAWWLAQALSNVKHPAPIPCGLVGTLGIGKPPEVVANGLTTPDPVLLQRHFRHFLDEGLAACAIEASSIGLAERRLDGTRIRIAVFTNFTHDHLDYHGSMEAYWQAKAELFRWPGLEAAVVNIDDMQGVDLAGTLANTPLNLWTVSCEGAARLQARDIGYGSQGLRFTVAEGPERHELETALIGQYNVTNLLGVIATMRALGVALAEAVQACRRLLPVPGRMDCLTEAGQPLVAVDYAHTPDALDKALAALRPLSTRRGGRLWCLFGCGGDRDPVKRPLMAAVAEKNADEVVITSDNPRSEKPEAIICQILLGLSHGDLARVQSDRALAIAETIGQAEPQDVVLIAGKGHEDYQEVAGIKHPFSDKDQARLALQRRKVGA